MSTACRWADEANDVGSVDEKGGPGRRRASLCLGPGPGGCEAEVGDAWAASALGGGHGEKEKDGSVMLLGEGGRRCAQRVEFGCEALEKPVGLLGGRTRGLEEEQENTTACG